MLIGEFTHTLDTKKRLAIPAKFRKEIGERAIITRGFDKCIVLYPFKQWEILIQKLGELSLGQSDSRSLTRSLVGGATEVEFDSLGRILIPDHLKRYAELFQKVVVVGVANRLEIWDAGQWERYRKNIESKTDALAEKLGELGVL